MAAGGPRQASGAPTSASGTCIEAERRGFAGRIRIILESAGRAPTCRPISRTGIRRRSPRPGATTCATVATSPPSSRRCADDGRGHGAQADRSGHRVASGIHPAVGPLTVDELLGEWVHHDRNHVRQLLAVTQARVWAQMGNARRFSLEEG